MLYHFVPGVQRKGKVIPMKIKDGFILRQVAGENVAIPSGDDMDLNMMITLNGTGKFLWERLENGAEEADLVKALLAEYDVDEETAATHVRLFVKKLESHGFFD